LLTPLICTRPLPIHHQVIPVKEWWKFSRAERKAEKMTVNEAMDMMKQQQRGYVVGGNKALDAKLSAVGEYSDHAGRVFSTALLHM
jgi:hypothetical protein